MAAGQGLVVLNVPWPPPEKPALSTIRKAHILRKQIQKQLCSNTKRHRLPTRVCVNLSLPRGHSKIRRQHAAHHVVTDDHVGRRHVFEGRVPISCPRPVKQLDMRQPTWTMRTA